MDKKIHYIVSWLLCVALCASCRTNKNIQKDVAVSVDSVTRTASHRTFVSEDSIVHKLSFTFDSLEVWVGRQVADTAQTIRLKAVKGELRTQRKEESLAAEHHEMLDTLVYQRSATDKTAEHTASTRIYDPPNSTVTIIVALLILAGLAVVISNRKL